MTMRKSILGALAGTALIGVTAAFPALPAAAQSVSPKPEDDVTVSVGAGKMVTLDAPMTDIFIADSGIADVQIRSSDQLYVFGKAAGETTIFATNASGNIVYSANVRVGNNIDAVGDMLRVTMPDADIDVTTMNGFVLLTGTVATPADVEDAQRLSAAFVGDGTRIISRLKTATPLQVMLQVKIAEVSRSLIKNIGVNAQGFEINDDNAWGFSRGREVLDAEGLPIIPENASTAGILGTLFGIDVAASIDANENSGLVSVLAEPTLTALSGETASFLAGGEFPIPVASGINGTSVEFKEYGVSLAFTPVVLESGRISMRVAPEVSELTSEGAIVLNNFEVPGLTTRKTETTVELGSGQSFMISGLMRNNANNSVEKTPVLGSLPIIGALFRSNGFRRNQTELVIVVTPYLVKPVNANQIALPTDGFRIADDPQRWLADQHHASRGEPRPGPVMAPTQTIAPGLTTGAVSAPAAPAGPTPGFSF